MTTPHGPLLFDIVPRFMEAEQARDLSPATISWKERNLKRLVAQLGGYPMLQITLVHLRQYVIWLKQQPLATETRRAHIRCLKDLFAFFYSDPLYEEWAAGKRNPAERIEIPSPDKRAPRAFDLNLLPILFRAATPGAAGVRDRAIIMVLLEGLRREEAVSLRVTNVDLARRSMYVFGKGRKERVVPISSVTATFLRAWSALRPRSADHVFCSLRPADLGHPLSAAGLQSIFQRWKERSKIDIMNPHSFRHCFASGYIANGGDARSLADILGHDDPEFTMQRYVHFDATHLVAMHNRFAVTTQVVALLGLKRKAQGNQHD